RTAGRTRAGAEQPAGRDPGGTSAKASVRPRASLTSRAAVLALVLGILAVSYAYPLRAWYDQHTRRAGLEQEAVELRDSVADLETELRLWDDPAYVRARARERLNFVLPGEVGFVVVEEPDATGGSEPSPGGVEVADEGPWYSRLWASVEAADAVPPEGDG
ncbi:MAG: FtsB family cell division protein, partial [Jiangellaceae bacterium]